jgi:hypothetical protein
MAMSEATRDPGWRWLEIDWTALVGVEVTKEQKDELSSRTFGWGPEHPAYDPVDDAYDRDPSFRLDNPYFPKDWSEGKNRREWRKLKGRCQKAVEALEDQDLRPAILTAFEHRVDIHPKGVRPSPFWSTVDLVYVTKVLEAIAEAPMPISTPQHRAQKRGELAAVIGQWWYEVTGTEPTKDKDWKKFSEFLLALVNLKISRSTFYKYWRRPEVRYSKGVLW